MTLINTRVTSCFKTRVTLLENVPKARVTPSDDVLKHVLLCYKIFKGRLTLLKDTYT